MRGIKIIACCLFLLFGMIACKIHWTKAVQKGTWVNALNPVTVAYELSHNLIIVPVQINGKTYRFLFDTGAPFSISEVLQKELNFPIISKGTIVDSDGNRKPVLWAKVDSVGIGSANFINQSAFVGDFESNPLIGCLEIDGILGSNLMRQCNWTIQPELQQITLFNDLDTSQFSGQIRLPFTPNKQYSMYTSLHVGRAKIKNVLIDYGYVGQMHVSKSIFNVLQEHHIVSDYLVEKGTKQSGIIGKAIPIERFITRTDSLEIVGHRAERIKLHTGHKNSIGNGLLSRYVVTIDWQNHQLYLNPVNKDIPEPRVEGFSIGVRDDNTLYVQSVVEGSIADSMGLTTLTNVVNYNGLDFKNGATFCDYFFAPLADTNIVTIQQKNGELKSIKVAKTYL